MKKQFYYILAIFFLLLAYFFGNVFLYTQSKKENIINQEEVSKNLSEKKIPNKQNSFSNKQKEPLFENFSGKNIEEKDISKDFAKEILDEIGKKLSEKNNSGNIISQNFSGEMLSNKLESENTGSFLAFSNSQENLILEKNESKNKIKSFYEKIFSDLEITKNLEKNMKSLLLDSEDFLQIYGYIFEEQKINLELDRIGNNFQTGDFLPNGMKKFEKTEIFSKEEDQIQNEIIDLINKNPENFLNISKIPENSSFEKKSGVLEIGNIKKIVFKQKYFGIEIEDSYLVATLVDNFFYKTKSKLYENLDNLEHTAKIDFENIKSQIEKDFLIKNYDLVFSKNENDDLELFFRVNLKSKKNKYENFIGYFSAIDGRKAKIQRLDLGLSIYNKDLLECKEENSDCDEDYQDTYTVGKAYENLDFVYKTLKFYGFEIKKLGREVPIFLNIFETESSSISNCNAFYSRDDFQFFSCEKENWPKNISQNKIAFIHEFGHYFLDTFSPEIMTRKKNLDVLIHEGFADSFSCILNNSDVPDFLTRSCKSSVDFEQMKGFLVQKKPKIYGASQIVSGIIYGDFFLGIKEKYGLEKAQEVSLKFLYLISLDQAESFEDFLKIIIDNIGDYEIFAEYKNFIFSGLEKRGLAKMSDLSSLSSEDKKESDKKINESDKKWIFENVKFPNFKEN